MTSWAQAACQGIHQVLLLGPCGWDPKLFTGLLQHRHGQLPQSAILQVGPQLVFWHLHFGLLLGSTAGISCDLGLEMKGENKGPLKKKSKSHPSSRNIELHPGLDNSTSANTMNALVFMKNNKKNPRLDITNEDSAGKCFNPKY